MILINSGAYVIAEFQAELGQIPPCMLPLGNQKLIEHQVAVLRQHYPDEPIYVTLPDSYQLALDETRLLDTLKVNVIKTADAFSLAESVLYALNISSDHDHQPVRLMYGDTLIFDLPQQSMTEVLGVAISNDNYGWHIEAESEQGALIWCGFYSFASSRALVQALALARGHFIDAIEYYRQARPLHMVHVQAWHDLGHINTYFRSRALMTTQRAFNTLKVQQGVVYKTGQPQHKIAAECHWLHQLPSALKRFIPQLIDHGQDETGQYYYQIEYLPHMPLNELFVHGRNTVHEWQKIFTACQQFLLLCRQQPIDALQQRWIVQDFSQLIHNKTEQRLRDYSQATGFDLHHPLQYDQQVLPSVWQIAQHCIEQSQQLPHCPAILHGDFCLSNVLLDSRTGQIKVIDPRGLSSAGELSLYGDQKYDLAKLMHSIIGLYDFIIAGRYRLTTTSTYHMTLDFELDERVRLIQQLFLNYPFQPDIQLIHLMPLTVLLFLSMLPLHADRPDRQRAMLANAVRLYTQLQHPSV